MSRLLIMKALCNLFLSLGIFLKAVESHLEILSRVIIGLDFNFVILLQISGTWS